MDDESRLVRAMARRDRSAWDAMYGRHVGDVYGVVYHLVGGDRQAAEDVNQEVWLLAIERFDRFDPARGGFRDWLLGIARHRALRHHRRAGVRADVRRALLLAALDVLLEAAMPRRPSPTPSPAARWNSADSRAGSRCARSTSRTASR